MPEPLEGWPEEPAFQSPFPARTTGPGIPPEFRNSGMVPTGGVVIRNYYAAPAVPQRRGPDPWSVVGWTVAAATGTAVLLAVALAAVAIAVSACALALVACVAFLLYKSAK